MCVCVCVCVCVEVGCGRWGIEVRCGRWGVGGGVWWGGGGGGYVSVQLTHTVSLVPVHLVCHWNDTDCEEVARGVEKHQSRELQQPPAPLLLGVPVYGIQHSPGDLGATSSCGTLHTAHCEFNTQGLLECSHVSDYGD